MSVASLLGLSSLLLGKPVASKDAGNGIQLIYFISNIMYIVC
jgi:hypothetical protein